MSVVLSEDLQFFLKNFIPEHVDEMLEAYSRPLPDSFRVNTLKISVEECLKILSEEEGVELRPVVWTRHGFYADPPGRLTTSLWHMLGLIYFQGPVSMLVCELANIEAGHRVLDLCAAPGSKATHAAQLLEGKGVLVANDVSRTRIKALSSNLQRCGVVNCVITLADGRWLGNRLKNYFDRVIVDAPCSSLGIGMKDWGVLRNWGEKMSQRLSTLQQALIFSGFKALKPGGKLIYATCTYHPLENEAVVSHLLEKFDNAVLESINVNGLKCEHGLEEWNGLRFSDEVKKTIRIFPYQSNAEGFYIAVVKKEV